MILRLSFEEVTALNSAAERLLSAPGDGGVLAPPEAMAELESRLPLEGDISVLTMAEQARLLRAFDTVLNHLKRRMDVIIVEQYVGSDDSVNAYFDYANVLGTRAKLLGLGEEMTAIIELISGEGTGADVEGLTFPD